ncbi:Oidioi.mRNA.OKI2018_I69.PAR.g9270.t1.cds [Oikopleura dioica]|uniref:Oidioi.mRNA.OKI2018_I69.PAR.g9270.t1.cds n=1 Tax=Oikopleura dioica TaxID=34765 RepID=A0ABN7RSF2_OIKDI|nr:Oidioi.mRNA.OKI2018_I69.PAR.g9270.t1.cds [Oikopleura dioica]
MYSSHRCSPSRAMALTGRYAFRSGMGSFPIAREVPFGMNTNDKTLPEYLKEVGYDTHAVGKWHLGVCNSSYLPTNRGFDTFYGHYSGAVDYRGHYIKRSKTFFHDFYDNTEERHKLDLQSDGEWTTDLFRDRTVEILKQSKKTNTPAYVYLAFNAPHEPTRAPEELIARIQEKHPEIAYTRAEHLAAVNQIDTAVREIYQQAKKDKHRETLIVFQSDNGGAVKKFGGGRSPDSSAVDYDELDYTPRACNYPYKGFKNSLFEGGVLSPSFLISTTRKFARSRLNYPFHIVDWVPTFLDFAGIEPDSSMDGISRKIELENRWVKNKRESFVYGVLDFYNEKKQRWEDQIAVRYGRYKFMNFNMKVNTFKCDENADKPVTVNSELRRFFDRPSSYWERVFSESITVADDYEKKVLLDGYSLYNLEEDPFEIENLVGPDSENPEAYSEIIEEILNYIEEQKSKGHVLPPIPGDENGKLYTRIFQRMGPVYGGSAKAYYETKRIIPIDIGGYYEKQGYLGTDWCTGNFYDNERDKFLELLDLYRGDPTKNDLVKDTNLLLSKSIFFQ